MSISREDFRNFIKAVEYNNLLKDKLVQCKSLKDLIILAKEHGYFITFENLNYDKTANEFDSWFKESRINPLKY